MCKFPNGPFWKSEVNLEGETDYRVGVCTPHLQAG